MARLIYTDSSNQERSVYLGPDQPLVKIGRASDCSIRTSRQSVSRRHAEFSYVEGTYEVTDLNSSNGTWLIEDDQRFEISHERLEDGDEIWCGDFIVHFTLTDLPADDPTVGGQIEVQSGGQPGSPSGQFREARQTSPPDPAAVDFSNLGLEELSNIEIGDAPPGQQRLTPQSGGAAQQLADPGEVARLREQKQSLEDLASRQTFEITDLQSQLDELTRRLEDGNQQVQAELDAAQQKMQTLERENVDLLEALDAKSQELEAQGQQVPSNVVDPQELEAAQAERDALQASLSEAEAERAELRQALSRAQSDLGTRDTQLDGLQVELERMQAQLADVPDVDADSLQEELEKGKRLLSEYERRNADLRIEFDAQREVNAELRKAYASTLEELEQTTAARDEAQQLLAVAEPARAELKEVRAELAQAEQLNEDLRAEVQGLKQRVQLERRRNKEGDAEASEQLRAELAQAQARIAELEASAGEAAPDAQTPDEGAAERTEALRERLVALERLTDAIARADLDPLSTVDRIRLQSAIRETDPKKTLQGALELLE